MYRGIWGAIVHLFRVPPEPPTLPVRAGEHLETFRPSPAFLRYLKFWFWIALPVIDVLILIAWIAITVAEPIAGIILALPALIIAVVPDVIVYIALHLKFDTMWYVMTDRSLRIRRGIWIIHETTITFENVQNVKVRQGPIQRHFGIADLIVETAGAAADRHQKGQSVGNQGVIEGVADAQRLRDLVLLRLRQSRTAGLGDEGDHFREAAAGGAGAVGLSPAHLEVLREIRGELSAMTKVG
jgi:membrane protein YdbS with pleckstrin-like domain